MTYLKSRYLLNFDGDCSNWWAQQERAVPASYDKKRRTAFLAAKFGTFTSSVTYGLRGDTQGGPQALLDKLTQQHGFDPERRRIWRSHLRYWRPAGNPSGASRIYWSVFRSTGRGGGRGFIAAGLFAGFAGPVRIHSRYYPELNYQSENEKGL